MSFSSFQDKVSSYTRPLKIGVEFRADNGRYYANLSNGDVIIGNSIAPSLTYRRFHGSGHTDYRFSA